MYYYGGIYLDADVEVFKSFTPLLNQKQFIGEEAGGDIEAAVMGAEKGLLWVKECLDYYHDRAFVKWMEHLIHALYLFWCQKL